MFSWKAMAATVPLLLLTACAVQPPTAVVSPVVSVPPSVVTPSPSLTPATTPGMTVAPPTVSPQLAPMVLGGSSIGDVKFGAAERDAVAVFAAHLGQPDDVFKGFACELDPTSPYSATYTYGALSILFLAKDRKSGSARTLKGWTYALDQGLTDALTLEGGLPADPTFDQLTQAYPKGKLTTDELGTVFTLPNGMRFMGDQEPDFVAAGPLIYCE